MKPVTLIIVLLFTASPGSASAFAIDDWFRDDLSTDERNELVERAKDAALEEIAPTVLKVLVDYRPIYAFGVKTPPWNDDDDRLSARDRTFLMAGAVWKHHMSPRNDLPKAKVMLSLLRMASRAAEKRILITSISAYQWCPDAEQVLLDLCNADEESLDVRRLAAESLLEHCDLNTYMPVAVEIILAHEKGLPRCQAFNFTTNYGNRLFELNDTNRNAVLAAGFGILDELTDDELQTGYFVAKRLGFILKTRNEFAPDQQAAKYQGKYGLKDEFFIDTVNNARIWHAQHKREIRSN